MSALVYTSVKVVLKQAPVLSSEDVNKRSINFKRFVLTAEVPTNSPPPPHHTVQHG